MVKSIYLEFERKDKNLRQSWTQEDNKKFLRFVILNRHKIDVKVVSSSTVRELCACMNKSKSLKQCSDKLDNLKKRFKSYELIVSSLVKKTKMTPEWINSLQKQKIYFLATTFSGEFQKVKTIIPIEVEALKLFTYQFQQFETKVKKQFHQRPTFCHQRLAQEEIFDHERSKNSDRNLRESKSFIQPMEQKQMALIVKEEPYDNERLNSQDCMDQERIQKDQSGSSIELDGQITQKHYHGWSFIEKLRFVLFIQKYEAYFVTVPKQSSYKSIFKRMSDFVKTKSSQYCKQLFRFYSEDSASHKEVIHKVKLDFYTTRNEILEETQKLNEFFENERSRELNAFLINDSKVSRLGRQKILNKMQVKFFSEKQQMQRSQNRQNIDTAIFIQHEKTNLKVQENKRVWTYSENMKFIVFVALNQRILHSQNLVQKHELIQKLNQYIGTVKTHTQCIDHLKYIKVKYHYKFDHLIKSQSERFNLSSLLNENLEFKKFQISQKLSIGPKKTHQ